MDPPEPDISLVVARMPDAFVEVREIPAAYNQRTDAEFLHNMSSDMATGVSNPVRDVASAADFWVIHTIGAYEEEVGNDWDPNGESNSWLGWAYQINQDKSNFIYYETIRDRQLNDPLPDPPSPVDLATLQSRVVFHEALHRFLGPHGGAASTGVAEGIMVYNTATYGDAEANELTPRQCRLIGEKDYPK